MEIAHLIIPVVTSVIGMAVSLLFVLLLRKQTEHDAGTKIGMLLGIAVSVMFIGICGTTFCKYYGLAEDDWLVRLSTLLVMTTAAFLPFLILWSWQVSPVLQWRIKFSHTLVVFAFVSGLGIVAAHLWMGLGTSGISPGLNQLLGLNVLICFLPAVVSIVRLSLDPRLRLFTKVTCSSYIFGATVGAFASFTNPSILAGMTSVSSIFLVLVRPISIVVGLLGSFIVAARFRFVDVFVRWSTRITILGVLSIFGTLSFTVVAFDVRPSWRGVGFLACTFETILLLLMGIILSEKCEAWVESHVLQRTDLKVEAARLYAKLFTLENKEDLFAFLERALGYVI